MTEENIQENNEINEELPKFEVKKVLTNDNFSMILYGLSRSGKSTFLMYLLNQIWKRYDIILFITHSENASVYKDLHKIKNIVVLNNYHDDVIKMMYELNKRFKNSLHILFVFDDYDYVRGSNYIKSLYTRGRNSNMSIINSVQSYAMIDKRNRENVNYAAIFRSNNSEYIEQMAPFLHGLIPYDKKIYNTRWKRDEYYKNYMNKHCQDYNFIVIDYLKNKAYKFKTPI